MQMKQIISHDNLNVVVLLVGTGALLASLGALNGGTALTASVWDALVTEGKTWLSSTYTLTLATLLLVIAVWQAGHGKGYALLGGVLAVLVIALVGPTVVTSVAKATRSPAVFEKQRQQLQSITDVFENQKLLTR